MRKKLVIIFLAIVLGLFIFKTDFCLALNEPENLNVPVVGEASSTLKWDWPENGGTLKQFKILYKSIDSIIWTARYPVAGSDTITYSLMGLSGNITYQWRVKAEAQNPINDSEFVDGPEFTTTQAPAPPPPDKNGNGNGFMDMRLKNPLRADTLWEAIDAVITFLVLASFAIAPILIIYSVFLIIFSAGDATKIKKGKDIIFWTVIAVAIILFAKGLPIIVKGIFAS